MKRMLKVPLLMMALMLSIFMAVGAVGIGNALAEDCGDTDYDGVHNIELQLRGYRCWSARLHLYPAR